VVDARHILQRLEDTREAAEQVAFADQIVLNKTELLDAAALAGVEQRLRRLNPLAPIHRAQRAQVPLDRILGRGGFDLQRIVELEPHFLHAGDAAHEHVHDEHCGHLHEAAHDHVRAAGIASVSLELREPVDEAAFGAWLQDLVARQGAQILRLKGIVNVQGHQRRLVVQGVHMLLEGEPQRPWGAQEARSTRLVFIGRDLDARALQAGLQRCAATASR
jgi:G3E family GTPase